MWRAASWGWHKRMKPQASTILTHHNAEKAWLFHYSHHLETVDSKNEMWRGEKISGLWAALFSQHQWKPGNPSLWQGRTGSKAMKTGNAQEIAGKRFVCSQMDPWTISTADWKITGLIHLVNSVKFTRRFHASPRVPARNLWIQVERRHTTETYIFMHCDVLLGHEMVHIRTCIEVEKLQSAAFQRTLPSLRSKSPVNFRIDLACKKEEMKASHILLWNLSSHRSVLLY